jgi:hypothetical protein
MIGARNTIKVNFSSPPVTPVSGPATAPDPDPARAPMSAVPAGSSKDDSPGATAYDNSEPGDIFEDRASIMDNGTSGSQLSKQYSEISAFLVPPEERKHGQVFFLVSNRWYQSWQHHVSEGSPSPGAINNWDLVYNDSELIRKAYKEANYHRCRFRVRDGLLEDRDFVSVPLVGWDALRHWYGGGPPLPRIVSQLQPSEIPILILYPTAPISVKEAVSGDLELLTSAGASSIAKSSESVSHRAPLAPLASSRSVDSEEGDGEDLKMKKLCGPVDDGNVVKKKPKSFEITPRVLNDCGKIPGGASAYCFTCRSPSRALSKCSKCSAVYYCGRECQTVIFTLTVCLFRRLQIVG